MNFIDKILPAPKRRALSHVRFTLAQSLRHESALALFLRDWACFERHARTPEDPYQFEEVVLGLRDPAFFDGRNQHNPNINLISAVALTL